MNRKIHYLISTIFVVFVFLWGLAYEIGAAPPWEITNQNHDFGTVLFNENNENTFTFENISSETLLVKRVIVQSPLKFIRTSSSIAPGEAGFVRVQIQEGSDPGPIDAQIVVEFKDDQIEPLIFQATGKIVPPIEFIPFKAIFASTSRGETKTSQVEIINHSEDPFKIVDAKTDCLNCTVAVETTDPGHRYKLILTLDGKIAPAGKHEHVVTLSTSSEKTPELKLKAFTLVKERVYTFPDKIEFGQVSEESLKKRPELLPYLSKTLMVYQKGGTNFQVKVETDVPFLEVSSERSKFNDRYQITLNVVPDKIEDGRVDGSIIIDTNDHEFPQLIVPVQAMGIAESHTLSW